MNNSLHKQMLERARVQRRAVQGTTATWHDVGTNTEAVALTGVILQGPSDQTGEDARTGQLVRRRVLTVEVAIGVKGSGGVPEPHRNGIVTVDADGAGEAGWTVEDVLYNDGRKCKLLCVRPIQQGGRDGR